jgi:hypothetical protein
MQTKVVLHAYIVIVAGMACICMYAQEHVDYHSYMNCMEYLRRWFEL